MRLPPDMLFIDGFAGGGGASTGIAQAIGREPDAAINHNPAALAIHKANHPATEHHCCDIRMPFLPRTVTRGRRVGGAWFSPDCKEFSKAKGGSVKERHIRMLAMEIPHWLEDAKPEVAYVENVEEFEDWGPLEEGEDGKWRVIIDRKGEDFKKWVGLCRRQGYRVDWRQLRACDYGAPTSRKRLYIVMRRDKKPIVWPKRTHAPANDNRVLRGELLPYRTAAECIDWSIPCPSIFERARPLKDATLRRIAHGVMRYVVNAQRPFIVPANDERLAPFVSYGQHGGANRPADEPHHTIAASKKDTNGLVGATLVRTGHGEVDKTGKRRGKGHHDLREPAPTVAASRDEALAAATMVKMGNGEREGQAPRALDINRPYGTVTAKGSQAAAVTAFLSHFYGSNTNGGQGDPRHPAKTVTADGQHHSVVCAHIEQANGGPRNVNSAGRDARRPLSTATTTGSQQRIVETTMIEEGALPPEMMSRAVEVAAFLVKYYGTNGENETAQSQAVDRPLDAITTKARFAVVTVTIDAVTYVIVDIGLRMLKPRELARAQGFPDDYILDPVVPKMIRGKLVHKPLTIAEQISAIGNSVCPPVARALVAANQPGLEEWRMAA